MDATIVKLEIPSGNNVVRTADKNKRYLALDGTTIEFTSDLFLPREDYPLGTGPEEYVSVDWLEYFDGDLRGRLNQVRAAVAARRASGKVGRQAQFAVVLAGVVHEAATTGHKTVKVSTTGDNTDPSHSGIYGLDPYDHIIGQEIARRAKPHPAYD